MKMVFALLFLAGSAFAEPYIGADGPTYKTVLKKDRTPLATGLIIPEGWSERKIVNPLPKLRGELPKKFTWQDKATPIKNQGNCGSCWAFSAQATIADVMALHGKGSLDLSEQFMVACDKESSGCSGGWYHSAFDLVKRAGNVIEKDYPYKAANSSCPSQLPKIQKIVAFKELSTGVAHPDTIKQAIYTYGPVSVAVSASGDFMNYSSGIYNSGASGGQINHAVNIVGWDDTVKPGHWIMRNSWGTGWGEKGYMRIAYGAKSIGYAASYVDFAGPVPHDNPAPTPTPDPSPTPKPDPTPSPCPDCPECTFWQAFKNLF